jgi:hypothetical protein
MSKFNLKKISVFFLILNFLIVSNANAKDPGGGASTIEELAKGVSEFLLGIFFLYVGGYVLTYVASYILSIAMNPDFLSDNDKRYGTICLVFYFRVCQHAHCYFFSYYCLCLHFKHRRSSSKKISSKINHRCSFNQF